MQFIEIFFYYTFSCSVVMLYGIGLEKTFFESQPFSRFLRGIPVIVLDSVLSVTALWYLVTQVLNPYKLDYLVPMSVLLICGIVHMFVTLFSPLIWKKPSIEQFFYFAIIFLAISEAESYISALILVFSGIVSFYLNTIALFAIRERMSFSHAHSDFKGSPLVLVSMGLLCIVLYSADVSWWLTEVFR